MNEPFVYLASQSPRRQELLRRIGVRFELLLPDDGEDAEALEAVRAGESPTAYVQRVTRAKAEAARDRLARRALPEAPIVVSDTTVAVGGRILGKPVDAADAARMLRMLSGRTHRVLSAVAVVRGRRIESALNVSRVVFARLPPAWIDAYVASGEPLKVAGAFTIDGRGAAYVSGITGDPHNVVGISVPLLRLMFAELGFVWHEFWAD